MRAAARDPGGGEIPMKRLSQPLFRPMPCEPGETEALCAWGVVSNKAQKKKLNVRNHGDRSAQRDKSSHRRTVPIFVPLSKQSKEVRICMQKPDPSTEAMFIMPI